MSDSGNVKARSKPGNKDLAQTILRAFQVLDTLTSHSPDLSLKDIAALTDLNKTIVARILNTLVHLDLVIKSESQKTYCLGPRLFEYGSRFIDQLDIRKLALPYMSDIATKTMDTVFLMLRSNDEALMLERIEGANVGGYMGPAVGGRLPMHVGAGPMALLVAMSDKEIAELAARTGLPRLGENSVQDVGTLLQVVSRIRKEGYRIAREDPTPGVVSIGAPIFDHRGRVIAGLSVGLLTPRFEKCNQTMYIDLITRAAKNLSREMGYKE